MTSKERVIAAITFNNPDRIPIDVWPVPAVYLRYGAKVDELFEKYPLDFAKPKWDPSKLDPRFKLGRYRDEWGVVWETALEGYLGMPVEPPLKDYRMLKSFKPPFNDIPGIVAPDDIAENPDKFWLGSGGEFFHRMCWLRGMDNVLVDLMCGPAELFKLREMLLEFYTLQVSRQIKTGVDAIQFSDDFGSQNQLLMPPAIWRSFIKPVFRELFAICKSASKFIFFHSDGYIMEIMEDFIEMGVDVLNSQVWCMGAELLGKKFRGRITFWGEIDRQHTLPHGSPDDVRQAAVTLKKHLSTPAGGLIGQGEIDGLTPLENIEALLTAWS